MINKVYESVNGCSEEDEKIRKWIVSTLKSLNNSPIQIDGAYKMMLPAIAWLEKQKVKTSMTKEEVLKKLRWKRDVVYAPETTNNITLKLIYKVQKDTIDRCIRLVEQINKIRKS